MNWDEFSTPNLKVMAIDGEDDLQVKRGVYRAKQIAFDFLFWPEF